jgi:hypothetical protein
MLVLRQQEDQLRVLKTECEEKSEHNLQLGLVITDLQDKLKRSQDDYSRVENQLMNSQRQNDE